MYDEIAKAVIPEISYLQLSSQLHGIFHVVSSAIDKTYLSLLNLQDQITRSAKGFLSMALFPPSNLLKVFRQIRSKMTSDLTLPLALSNEDVMTYYKLLHPTVLPDKGKFDVLMALPLVHVGSKMDIFEVISVPVPEPSVSLSCPLITILSQNLLLFLGTEINMLCLAKQRYRCAHKVLYVNYLLLCSKLQLILLVTFHSTIKILIKFGNIAKASW